MDQVWVVWLAVGADRGMDKLYGLKVGERAVSKWKNQEAVIKIRGNGYYTGKQNILKKKNKTYAQERGAS